MIKKSLLMLALIGLIAGSSIAQSRPLFSIGAGGYFTNDFGGGFENTSTAVKTDVLYSGWGVRAFFDATFVELSVGMLAAGTTIASQDMSLYGIDFSVFGKIPIYLGKTFVLFPLLGADYRLVLSAADKDGKEYINGAGKRSPGDLSALWLKAGIGLDFSINEAIFLRGEALYGIRFKNGYETEKIDSSPNMASLLGHGLSVNLALGYRFN